MVLAAENALETLIGDDSRRVSSMALEAYSDRKRNNATIVSDREDEIVVSTEQETVSMPIEQDSRTQQIHSEPSPTVDKSSMLTNSTISDTTTSNREGEIVESPIQETVSMPIGSSSQTQKQMQIEQQLLHKHQKLFLALKSDITHNRRTAASKLGKSGDASVVPFLVEAYDDPDPFVRRNIIIALNQINSPTASEFLTSLPDSEKDSLMDIKKTNALLQGKSINALQEVSLAKEESLAKWPIIIIGAGIFVGMFTVNLYIVFFSLILAGIVFIFQHQKS